ncbi:MAG: ISKra4 family transposase [Gammaproteobacteria bacterium]|nr:ISKra4 family transposase [Gammaproteobacteria bacterium]
MRLKIQVVIEDEGQQSTIEDIITIEKGISNVVDIGLSLRESKQVLKKLQQFIVQTQAQTFVETERKCPSCNKNRRIKGNHCIQYRTLFGIVVIQSPRFYHCVCDESRKGTFSLLKRLLPEHISPELKYIEAKWASLMSYGLTAELLKDILPVSSTLNASTVKNHLFEVASKMEADLKERPDVDIGCGNDWARLPKPEKPLTVGIDGGYVRNWHEKKTNFEVVAGKSVSKTREAKRFGFVQKYDSNPRHRLMDLLRKQGMQANQQIDFLSDGAENLSSLQFLMFPEANHTLDWFHITMRLTVLNQFAKGLTQSDPKQGNLITKDLESTKWYLWHGNAEKALDKLEDCYLTLEYEEIKYKNHKRFLKYLDEMNTYIRNNRHLIPNYGEKNRYGESITTAFVESTINEVVAKRMVKKQQMQWSHQGAHYMIQTRTAVLNGDLASHFERWHPGFNVEDGHQKIVSELEMAA